MCPCLAHLHQLSNRSRFVVMLVWLIGSILVTDFAIAIIIDYLPAYPPLPDVWFTTFEERFALGVIAEVLTMFFILVTLLVALVHSSRWLVLCRIAYLAGLLYYARAVCMTVTLLPNQSPSYHCAPSLNHTFLPVVLDRVRVMLITLGSSTSGIRDACGDLIFSGHSMVIVLACLVFQEYAPRRFRVSGYYGMCVVATFTIFSILTSRMHYSIDVMLAYYLTTRTFWAYHDCVHMLHLEGFGGGAGENTRGRDCMERGEAVAGNVVGAASGKDVLHPMLPSLTRDSLKPIGDGPYGHYQDVNMRWMYSKNGDWISSIFWYPLIRFIES